MKDGLVYLSPAVLLTHPRNMRRFYPEDEVGQIAASMNARMKKGRHPLIHPLRVVPTKHDKYYVVDGNMRLAAARLLRDCIPLKCEVVSESEADQLITMLVTAKMRFKPDPISEALHYRKLIEEEKYTVRMISDESGICDRTVETRMEFTYADIAVTKGITVHGVRRAVSRGILDPTDLESICRYLGTKRGPKGKGEE